MKKVILTAALTGAVTTRKQCPHIPYTPKEIAQEAKRAYDEGATIVHIHAREDDGSPSWRPERFLEIETEVRNLCPVVINFSTGGIGNSIQERTEYLEICRPEMAALNMGSMNYAVYSSKNKKFYFDEVFSNPFKDIIFTFERMKKRNVVAEMECFDMGHVANSEVLMDMGFLKPPFHYSLVIGVTGGIKASPENLEFMAKSLPKGSHWQVIGISRDQWTLAEQALKLGGNIRVGLEDNFYLPDGVTVAKGNGALAKAAAQLVQKNGLNLANLQETRSTLHD